MSNLNDVITYGTAKFRVVKNITSENLNYFNDLPVGTILSYSGNSNTPPATYLFCEGQAISRTMYSELFSILGTTYGSGDGETTFNLPDLRDKFIEGSTTAGTNIAAGLPNITGSFVPHGSYSYGTSIYDASGAFLGSGLVDKYHTNESNNTGQSYCVVSLDASRSSSIYGNSTTVQPPAIKLIPQIKYRKDTSNTIYNDTPIGTVISYMGNTAPKDYLVCDGTIYNISDYKELAEYIKVQFGSYNYFGGDGITTFAVPDLRGEFLRGTGTNSHTNQGSGASVGVHQDGTEIPNVHYNGTKLQMDVNTSETKLAVVSEDKAIKTTGGRLWAQSSTTTGSDNLEVRRAYTSRPTNTSVLYCIKYNTSILSTPENNYSTEEQRIGTWIDGKPLYQKTFVSTNATVVAKTDFVIGTLTEFDKVINISPIIHWNDSDGTVSLLNLYSGATGTNAMTMNNTYIGSFCMYTSGANSGNITFANNTNVSGIDFYITLQYTKTID